MGEAADSADDGKAGDSGEAGTPRLPPPKSSPAPPPAELDELLRRQLPRLEGFVRRRAGALLRRESGADLVQSVCREVLADLRAQKMEFRGETPFQRWLYQAALLKLRDRRRYWAAEQRADQLHAAPAASAADAARAAWLSSIVSPSAVVLRQEELALVEECVAQLEPRQREVLQLSRLEGKSHAEIAAQLSISEANSRMLLSRALARLTTLARRKLPRPESP